MKSKVIIALLGFSLLVGCGSSNKNGSTNGVGAGDGSSVDKGDDNSGSGDGANQGGGTPTTAKGVYQDSPIDGVTFICGTRSGITGGDGEAGGFTYEIGQPCSFQLNNVELTKVTAEGLEGGIVKPNHETARYLQSLDKDGNASNGIVILPEVRKALLDKNITGVQLKDQQVKDMVAALSGVAGYSGKYKTMQEAGEHLAGFSVSLTADKASYVVGDKVKFTAGITGNNQGLTYLWKDENDKNLSTKNNKLVVINFSEGRHKITVEVTNQDDVVLKDTLSVEVASNNFTVDFSVIKDKYNKDEQVAFDLAAPVTSTITWKDNYLKWKDGKKSGPSISNDSFSLDTPYKKVFGVGHHDVTVTVSLNNVDKNKTVSFDVEDWTDFNRTTISGDRVMVHNNLMWVDEPDMSKKACAKIKKVSETNTTLNPAEFTTAKTFCSTLDGKFTNLTGWRIPTAAEVKELIESSISANTILFYDAACGKVLAYNGGNKDVNSSFSTVNTRYSSSAGAQSAQGDLKPNIGLRCVRNN